jgi:hypothetical protein
VNLGAGYEFTTFKEYNEFYFATNLTALNDSHDNMQYTISSSPNIRFNIAKHLDALIGVAAFAMWKKDVFKVGVSRDNAEYDLVYGAAPLASIYYKRVSVNFAYVPSVSYEQIDKVGFLIMYFGWKFN